MISTAVSPDRVSRIVGYEVKKGTEVLNSPNLPQRIAVLGQANTLNQTGLITTAQQVTSEQQAGELFGFGSQIHQQVRILLPRQGVPVLGAIPVVVYAQPAPGGGVAEQQDIVADQAAVGTGVIVVRINGRTELDGDSYQVGIADGDTVAQIHQKIADVINSVVSCPVSAVASATECRLTTKWVGAATQGLNVAVEGDLLGITYSVTQNQAGAGASTADITTSLGLFGSNWNTIVTNPYGSSENGTFEDFNGIPGVTVPTGRYQGIVFKPFVALVGKLEDENGANEITDLADNEVTMVNCPAPNSLGWAFEAAANVAVLLARQAQDNPHLDVAALGYPDMPVPADGDIGIYTDYNDRDILVKGGASTVDLINGQYVIQDLITGYRPAGENPPQFRYVRSLIQDWNIRYGYLLLEAVNVVDKAIAESDQPVIVANVIKPKQWIQILNRYADDLAERAITVDAAFMKNSTLVETDGTNPDRLNTSFRYKRSPFTRIASTTGEANFAFGVQ